MQVFIWGNSWHIFLIEPTQQGDGQIEQARALALCTRHTCSPADNWQQFAYQFIASGIFVFELTLLGSISLQLRWALLAMAMHGPNFVASPLRTDVSFAEGKLPS